MVERGVAIWRASIRQYQGDLAAALADITAALAWYERHLQGDTRSITEMQRIRDSIPNT